MPDAVTQGPRTRRRRAIDGRILFSLPILALVLVFAVFADLLVPYDPNEIDFMSTLSSPTWAHLMGTDELGRDILSRVITGSRISLGVAVSSTLLACLVGATLGIVVTYFGGIIESMVTRVVDILIALPDIFFAVLMVTLLPPSLTNLILTISLIYAPQFARLMNGVTASVKRRDYILAARSMGASDLRIMFGDILPNVMPIIVVKATLTLSTAMLLEAGLSFLGLGVAPPTSSWGQMIGSLKTYLFNNPWPIVFPATILFAVILAVNLLGDWLQDHLSPEAQK